MDMKSKIDSASIKGPTKLGEGWVVTVNGQEFRGERERDAIVKALEYVEIPATSANIDAFIDLAVQGRNPPKAYPSDITPVKPVKGVEGEDKIMIVVTEALDYIPIPVTNANTGIIDSPAEGEPSAVSRNELPPPKPVKKRKGKVKKPEPENKFVGKVFLTKKGELVRVVSVTPPADWQFELECLDENKGNLRLFGLKEFKELTELVPKRSKKKEG